MHCGILRQMRTLAGVAATLLMVAACASQTSQENVLIIMADDVGIGDISALGSQTLFTPNIDRIFHEGATFTQFMSAPLCSPGRAALLTSVESPRNGVYTSTRYPLDLIYRVFLPVSTGCIHPNATVLPPLLKERDQFVTYIGKAHTGSYEGNNCTLVQKGFDYYYGLQVSHEEGFPGPPPENVLLPPVSVHENLKLVEQPADLLAMPDRYLQRSLEVIRLAGNDTKHVPPPAQRLVQPGPRPGQSFFMVLAFESSHVPLYVNEQFRNTSRRGPFGDMTLQMDEAVGQVLREIEAQGIAESTTVIFTSDNGAWVAPSSGFFDAATHPEFGGRNGELRGEKGSTYQGGVQVPFALWAPGRVSPGQQVQEPASMMDVMPTFLKRSGVQAPAGLDGRDFWPWLRPAGNSSSSSTSATQLLEDGEPSPAESADRWSPPSDPLHDFLFYWRGPDIYAVRGRVEGVDYKAHFLTRPGFGTEPPTPRDPPLLFNMQWDYGEKYPLNTTEPAYAQVARRMTEARDQRNSTIVRVPSQLEALDWSVAPCCGKPYNQTEADQFWAEGKPGLAVWDSCVCSNATNRPPA